MKSNQINRLLANIFQKLNSNYLESIKSLLHTISLLMTFHSLNCEQFHVDWCGFVRIWCSICADLMFDRSTFFYACQQCKSTFAAKYQIQFQLKKIEEIKNKHKILMPSHMLIMYKRNESFQWYAWYFSHFRP